MLQNGYYSNYLVSAQFSTGLNVYYCSAREGTSYWCSSPYLRLQNGPQAG